MSKSGRDIAGKFAPGNAGGPGRPRRPIEADYLAAMAEAVPLTKWKAIVDRAVADALAGDPKAREWLGRYLIGEPSGTGLVDMAAAEHAAIDPVQTKATALKNEKFLTPSWIS